MSDTPRERWLRGACPCCGADLDWWPTTEPAPIAEGVMMCGPCIENEHHINGPNHLRMLLDVLVTGGEVEDHPDYAACLKAGAL